jgi:hypothetical protein
MFCQAAFWRFNGDVQRDTSVASRERNHHAQT